MKRHASSLFLIACAALTACSNQSTEGGSASSGGDGAISIIGAGSSFDYPFFSRAFYAYQKQHPNVSVNYQSIGSGGGIQQFSAKTVDFGATDVPMNAKELQAIPEGSSAVIQIPVTLGGVALAYNLPEAPRALRLSPNVVAGIFLGKITSWSDPAIAGLNGGVRLKDTPIIVVHRADGSGTTYIFTDYLVAVSEEWKRNVGKGKTVSWPAASGVGAKGNEGVAGQIRNAPGSIGYVELAYALQNKMTFAVLQNRAGNFVAPSLENVASAAASRPSLSAASFSIVNAAAARSYPIAGFSWVLLYKHYADPRKGAALKDLFHWLLADGQKDAKALDYVALPSQIAAGAQRQLSNMR